MNFWPMHVLMIAAFKHLFDEMDAREKPMLEVEKPQRYQKSALAVTLQRALWLGLALLLTLHVLPDRLWAHGFDLGPPRSAAEVVQS